MAPSRRTVRDGRDLQWHPPGTQRHCTGRSGPSMAPSLSAPSATVRDGRDLQWHPPAAQRHCTGPSMAPSRRSRATTAGVISAGVTEHTATFDRCTLKQCKCKQQFCITRQKYLHVQYYHKYNLCVYICYRSITKQINEAVGKGGAQRTVTEVRNKV